MSRFDKRYNKPPDINDDMAIFFTSNTYKLNENYEFFKSEKIPIIIVDLNKEELTNLEDLNLFKFKIIDSSTNKVVLKNFQTLMLSVLGIRNEYFNLQPFDFSNLKFESNIEEINKFDKINQIEKQETLFTLIDNPIRIIEGNKCIGKIKVNSDDIDYGYILACWIEHSNQVLLIHRDVSGSIYNKHGKLIRKIPQISHDRSPLADRYSTIEYCRKNKFTYFCQPINQDHSYTWDSKIILFNEYLDLVDRWELDRWEMRVNDRRNHDIREYHHQMRNQNNERFNRRYHEMRYFDEIRIRGRQIKIYDDFIYTLHCSWGNMYVYDLKLNVIAVINQTEEFKWRDNIFESTHANYLFQKNCILNTKTFSIISKNLKSEPHGGLKLRAIHNDKFIFATDRTYKIYMNNPNSKIFIDDKYLCKINPLQYHLLKDALVLPCGNMICNNCFYENYNIYLNKFICNFVSCQKKHEINFCLDPNNHLIENSAGEILKEMMDNCNRIYINNKSNF